MGLGVPARQGNRNKTFLWAPFFLSFLASFLFQIGRLLGSFCFGSSFSSDFLLLLCVQRFCLFSFLSSSFARSFLVSLSHSLHTNKQTPSPHTTPLICQLPNYPPTSTTEGTIDRSRL
ncbi:hypothetical protein DM02DRAFT_126974 [Periconia macrospinosa]|uniref:Transmembrane protein n=1 Tax=Periconia macrospinosa TaxID=97972 RepID=A0A2V1E4M1_9PLEO|nr:hypothetical protein DM02DRAFT_126974 [Periconia macrospinosa]